MPEAIPTASGGVQITTLNPILPGFNPDPSICRKENEFFIATSSFQWWPAVPIYRSNDLARWERYCYALTNPQHLNMLRIQDSAGIWAPCLSYADGLFWLIFTIANGSRLNVYECVNYLITAADPAGPWSDPIYLNSSGNDPALFHDDDGRKWLVNSYFRRTPGKAGHKATVLQEFSVKERRLIGSPKQVFQGTGLAALEGSKLFKRRGQYFLVIAEGGTGYRHQATMARAETIDGPYDVHPENPILTAHDDEANPIQRAGHVDLVEVNDEESAVVYLGSRPVNGHSMLGRETFLARGRWYNDGWLRLDSQRPAIEVPDFNLPERAARTAVLDRDDFDQSELSLEWNSPRVPIRDRADLLTRPSWLRLRGTPSCIDSLYEPSILCRRATHHQFRAETVMEFMPSEPDQWGGIVCYYDSRHWYYLARLIEPDEADGVMLMRKPGPRRSGDRLDTGINRVAFANLGPGRRLRLGVDCDGHHFQFRYAEDGEGWRQLGGLQDCLLLSDEFVEGQAEADPIPTMGFTGTMLGFAAYDLTLRGDVPSFDSFTYEGIDRWPAFLSSS